MRFRAKEILCAKPLRSCPLLREQLAAGSKRREQAREPYDELMTGMVQAQPELFRGLLARPELQPLLHALLGSARREPCRTTSVT